jgi:hypothetical protein
MKLIQCEKPMLSGSLIDEEDQVKHEKQHRFKTEGCEVGVSVDKSFGGMSSSSTERKEK